MTLTQPSPPAPRSPDAMAAENAALAQQIANQALRDAAGARRDARAGAPQPTGVVRGADGRIVVTGPDGRQVIIDPKAVSDEDAIQRMVQTALEPPPLPRVREETSGGDVAVVAIIFPCLIVIMLIVWRIVVTSRRPASATAGAAVGAELAGRLTRIEQAIEAVAIEVERISESERYSARLLTERLPEARPGAAARLETPTANVPR